jgi:cytochrome oxidase Cu insertion factor (SCO1/SenC/PrrC family)
MNNNEAISAVSVELTSAASVATTSAASVELTSAASVAARRMFLKCLALGLSVCALALAPAQAQQRTNGANVQRDNSKLKDNAKQKKAVAYYSCPMDKDVRAKAPGRCPKCGMELRPVREEGADAGAAAASLGYEAASSPDAQPTVGENGRAPGMNIPDIELLDQDGRKVHFYSDLVKGKTVVINFIFTTCTTICPPLGATFARVQKELGDRTGRDVHFISISVDPATDTPERLKAWGAKFHAGPGWTFVTGDKPSVDKLLGALAASSARREDHSPEVLIGNDARGIWTRTYGLAGASKLIQIINDAIEGKTAEGKTAEGKTARTPEGVSN